MFRVHGSGTEVEGSHGAVRGFRPPSHAGLDVTEFAPHEARK